LSEARFRITSNKILKIWGTHNFVTMVLPEARTYSTRPGNPCTEPFDVHLAGDGTLDRLAQVQPIAECLGNSHDFNQTKYSHNPNMNPIGKHEEKWMNQYAQLKEHVQKYKEFPTTASGSLGKWVSTQRLRYKAYAKNLNTNMPTKKMLPISERIRLLEELPGWAWDCNEPAFECEVDVGVIMRLTPMEQKHQNRWMKSYIKLKKYVDEHGTLPNTKTNALGKWIRTQRVAYKTSKGPNCIRRGWPTALISQRIILLEKIAGWTWNATAKAADLQKLHHHE